MGRVWTFLTYVHSAAGPTTMLLYPLYASVIAIESPSKLDDEQWLAYWILYSFLTLVEILFQPILEWIPIWYDVKLAFILWLVLPQFRGAAFIYEKFVRDKIIKRYGVISQHVQSVSNSSKKSSSPDSKSKSKNKFVDFISPKKSEREAY
ncbi:OLC1v1013674C1 [Oldenlandia corymbosa var. corymbosa]|uniref:HVA22-like protein n=1 Tax=Oldenlandia corymbosa var. corymbosa TaxID=529605 RepID=A0AAV1E0Z0_OLDCO|nr:OLC1v1013674C1 [Oldenlandia corymbosa var. corymbosa]